MPGISLYMLRPPMLRVPVSLRRRTAIAYGSAAAVLIVGAAALTSIKWQQRASATVEHTYRMIGAIATVATRLSDARAAERAFGLTGDPRALAAYHAAAADAREAFARLRAATTDPTQRDRLAQVGPMLDQQLDPLDSAAAHPSPARADSVLRASDGPDAVALRDAMRSITRAMAAEEVEVLARQTAQYRRRQRYTVAIIVAGTALACLCIALTVGALSRGAHQLVDVNAQLNEQTLALEEQATELEATNEDLRTARDALEAQTAAAEHGAELERVARADADRANQAKSELLATMSHELRTPLNAIAGYAELMAMGLRGPLTAEQSTDLERIQRSQRHLLGLINSILAFARLEAGQEQFALTTVAVADVLTSIETMVLPQLAAKGLTYASRCADATLAVRADASKVTQILLNLVSNAVKFTDPDGRIDVTCDRAGDRAYLHVRDTGCGVPPEQLDAIFEPFVQVDRNLSRPVEGVGLGLSISMNWARRMGGGLTVASVLGEGSTFTLFLPVADLASTTGERPRLA